MKVPRFILNIPNILSIGRFAFIPVFLYFLSWKSVAGWVCALIVFALASITDVLDGWAARKLNQETEFGKFIDPLADKFLVVASLAAFLVLDPYLDVFDLWMIFIIAGRDVLLTFMRFLAIRRGRPLRTSRFGKIKTTFQMVSIVIIIMIYIVQKSGIVVEKSSISYITHASVPYWIMIAVTIITAISGLRYIYSNWELFLPVKKNKK
ncbi:MAG: CDP-diacylglycerol--glycerol-3-phosphate 3-phosphatidyltransferase [bacterium]|nr:CDP-diacylglycerol--glycerol-3-phosphate 3-phosphatidyltransferase [bacterium]